MVAELVEKLADFGEHVFAAGIPLMGAAEKEGGVTEAGEAEFLGTGGAEFGDIAAEVFEEGEFEAVACGFGGADEGEGDGRGEGFEVIGDGFAADADEHVAHAFEEFVEGEEAEVAAGFEVGFDAFADFRDEGEVVSIGCGGGSAQGIVQPRGIVVEDLAGSDLDGGPGSDEGDHVGDGCGSGGWWGWWW